MLAAADQNQKLKNKALGESLGSPSEVGFPAPSTARLAVNSTMTGKIFQEKRSRGMKRARPLHHQDFYYRISKRFTNTSAEEHHEVHTSWYTRENKGNGPAAARRCWGRCTAAGTRTSRSSAVATRPPSPRCGKPKREKELQDCSVAFHLPSETKPQLFYLTGRISSLLAEVRCPPGLQELKVRSFAPR